LQKIFESYFLNGIISYIAIGGIQMQKCEGLFIPDGYRPNLSIKDTEIAIKFIKDRFENILAKEMNLTRVSAPLFVRPESGLNDNLNGVERPVSFDVPDAGGKDIEIVHSLAKWKRMALIRYDFTRGEGLYTDMNAIRRDEKMDNIHSIYVDQWDWEIILDKSDRNEEMLKSIVRRLFTVFKKTEDETCTLFPSLQRYLPEEICFITSQELEDMYPDLEPKEREELIVKEKKAVFIMKIGSLLKSGKKHDGRAPDYDDWELNGDILFWYPVLDKAIEISSMGIRVDEESLVKQLKIAGCEERLQLPFHKSVYEKRLPYTAGGGIGQSRMCMFYLGKAHVGEVQSSIWPQDMVDACREAGIQLL
jgi:aspartate--ammonia ligase